MAIKGVNFKWYDVCLFSMLATRIIIVAINWKRYHSCTYPLHVWIVVDSTTVIIFRILMFVDNKLAGGMGLNLGWQQTHARSCGRIAVLSILVLLLYPFLFAWTIIGTVWFIRAKTCLPEYGQRWGFLVCLLFSYCGLVCIACICLRKWSTRRWAHLLHAQRVFPVSEHGVLLDMVGLPDLAIEPDGQDIRGMDKNAAAYHPGFYLTPAQREAVEALIQELPKWRLKAVPTDCSECPNCLEEFHVGNEVRGPPCVHSFRVACIDEWLRLNTKCPRCRCFVFPNLDLSASSNIHTDSGWRSTSVVMASPDVSNQSPYHTYLLRLQGLICPIGTENTGADSELDSAETSARRGLLAATHCLEIVQPVQVVVEESALP